MPSLDKILETENVATILSEAKLRELGDEVVEKTEVDMASRNGWMDKNKLALELAALVPEKKNFPWANASSVKYPLITMASIQFHARASQSLLSAARPVKGKIIGSDKDGSKAIRAEQVSLHMSHQVLNEMPHWQDENDRLLLLLAIVGLAYKKQYRCPIRNQNVSELVLPQNLVVNYNAKDFELCRKTEVYSLTRNAMLERMRRKVFLEFDLDLLNSTEDEEYGTEARDKILELENTTTGDDDTSPFRVYDQHYEWDLDGDGYAEPYIVSVGESSKRVLKITKRFTAEDVKLNEESKVYKVETQRAFTRYIFIPEVNSPIYAFGLGTLLNPLNEAVNTILNQLIDAGTLATLQGGFIGRGIRMPQNGSTRFRPGEWKVATSTGDDLRKNIVPLPVKEPSSVLFQLLGLLIQAGEEISSVADLMKGESPGQNQPFSTTAAMLEQGMQVFTSIYKRLFRSFKEEYNNLYKLNGMYLAESEWTNILDPESEKEMEVSKYLYEGEGVDVLPEADPDVLSQTQRQLKAESLMGKVEMGLPINPAVVTRRMLEAEGHEDIEELVNYEPPPDPEMELKKQQHADKMELEWAKIIQTALTSDVEELKDSSQAMAHIARAEHFKNSSIIERMKVMVDMAKASDEMDSKEEIEKIKGEAAILVAKEKPSASKDN